MLLWKAPRAVTCHVEKRQELQSPLHDLLCPRRSYTFKKLYLLSLHFGYVRAARTGRGSNTGLVKVAELGDDGDGEYDDANKAATADRAHLSLHVQGLGKA